LQFKEITVESNLFFDPMMNAAIKACELAESQPGCLVRVTMRSPAEIDTMRWAQNYLNNRGLLDREKTTVGVLILLGFNGGTPTLELKNGSGIEFVFNLLGQGVVK
jgi:hypothetical protein